MPKVTFIVPCYRLAHVLPDCIGSILRQDFDDFEVLIMDDCSPDDTPAVSKSFNDDRVIHVRNEPNLGHLRNYNKAIALSRGEYIWLVSADDRLRGTTALSTYVRILDANPNVGYVFSPTMNLVGDRTTLAPWSVCASTDFIASGVEFLRTLARGNKVAACAGMARKSCYELDVFPLDMPFAGDWYLWCRFLFGYDMAYVAEPQCDYRLHDANMTLSFSNERLALGIEDELRVLSRLIERARVEGAVEIRDILVKAIVDRGADVVRAQVFGADGGISYAQLSDFLTRLIEDAEIRSDVRALVAERIGDEFYQSGDLEGARKFYESAAATRPAGSVTSKLWLLRLGPVGKGVRGLPAWARNR